MTGVLKIYCGGTWVNIGGPGNDGVSGASGVAPYTDVVFDNITATSITTTGASIITTHLDASDYVSAVTLSAGTLHIDTINDLSSAGISVTSAVDIVGRLTASTLHIDGTPITFVGAEPSFSAITPVAKSKHGYRLTYNSGVTLVQLEDTAHTHTVVHPAPNLAPYTVRADVITGALSTTAFQIPLDVEVYAHSNYSLASGEITVVSAGMYQISTMVTVDQSSDVTSIRGGWKTSLETQNGAAWNTNNFHTIASKYFRELTAHDSITHTFNIELSATQKIRLMMQLQPGYTTQTFSSVTRQSTISMMRVGEHT